MHTHHVLALAALAGALSAAPAAVQAQTQSATGRTLASCRAIAEAAARLACYDALPLPAAAAAASTGSTAVAAPAPAARPGAAATASPAPAAVAAAPAAASFGIDRPVQGELQEIASRFEGDFDGWGPNSRIKLANGQVWQVTDGSSAPLYLKSPRVTVKRALLGGYVMEFEGTNRTAKVRRVE